jgi:hypothetical protein
MSSREGLGYTPNSDHIKAEEGDLVYVGLYIRPKHEPQAAWRLDKSAGFVGTVMAHPDVHSVYPDRRQPPEEQVNVKPYEPLPVGDTYGTGHPLLVTAGEHHTAPLVSGTQYILYRTVELIVPDTYESEAVAAVRLAA